MALATRFSRSRLRIIPSRSPQSSGSSGFFPIMYQGFSGTVNLQLMRRMASLVASDDRSGALTQNAPQSI